MLHAYDAENCFLNDKLISPEMVPDLQILAYS